MKQTNIASKEWVKNEINAYESKRLFNEKIKKENKEKEITKAIWIYILLTCVFLLGAYIMYNDMRTDFLQTCVTQGGAPLSYCKEAFKMTFGGLW